MIFVVGCGRTGTHWLANSLAQSGLPLIDESSPLFQLSVEAALRPALRSSRTSTLARKYRQRAKNTVDKCHPNLWIAPELAVAVPGSKFLITSRSLEGTVRSMLNHAGSLRWALENDHYDADCCPGFLGRIPAVDFTGRTPAARCAARAVTHMKRGGDVASVLRHAIIFDYDLALDHPDHTSERLSDFLSHRVTLIPPRRRELPPLTDRQRRDVEWICRQPGPSLSSDP